MKRISISKSCLVAFIALLLSFSPVAANADGPSLGFSKNFQEGTVFVIHPGQSLPPVYSIYVDNPGDQNANVVFEYHGPKGITISPLIKSTLIAVDKGVNFAFSIAAAKNVAPGNYKVAINVRQIINPTGTGLNFAPAVGASFIVQVQNTDLTPDPKFKSMRVTIKSITSKQNN